MSQCLRCRKPGEVDSVFCSDCRTLLRSQLWQTANTHEEMSIKISPVVAMSPEGDEVSGDPLERITSPYPAVQNAQMPQTPPPEAVPPPAWGPQDSVARIDQTLQRLNEAAQRIAQVEQGQRRLPHASRLAPLHDISADIQRHSTPLPQISHLPESEQGEDLGKRLPDFWPWLQETDESENDQWSNHTDPLQSRQFPNSAEVARIEEEDRRRAIADGLITLPEMPQTGSTKTRNRVRLAFSILAVLAVLVLVMDSVLISLAFLHPRHTAHVLNGPPSITLSSNVARVGQTISLHIHHFSANASVYITHDIQEPVQLTSGSAVVKVDGTGSADVALLVDSNWTPGFHTIEAEDVSTRYTASVTLQITGAGPTRPSHLLLDTTNIDFGPDLQGANSIQSLKLHNSGSGSISWSGNSSQPWLLLSPPQGMFSQSQTIAVAVERANLKPGDYKGTLTFSSNVGSEELVQVQMTVRPLPPNSGAVLEVIPPVLSFTALDGEANPPAQSLMINNPGSQVLNWSIASNNPLPALANQNLLLNLENKLSWLSTDQTVGSVVPHASSNIHIFANSRSLLPGVYTEVLSIVSSHGINSPQSVSVSLTIQPRCGLSLNAGSMSFIAVSGQSNPSNQSLSLSATSSCTGVINWKAISASNWLTVTPASGQLKGSGSTVTSIGVNASILKPGTYSSNISFTAAQSTQTVMVLLVVQARPPPSAPILGATPLSLNFSTTQGMPNPPGQVVTITNTGGSQLNWRTQVTGLASSWLGAGPTGGTIAAGQTGQVTVLIDTQDLTPNTYVGQVTLIGTDASGATASGSPQTVTVTLQVLPPCTLEQPSLSSVSFTATQGMPNPSPQTDYINASGNCAWPLSWHASVKNAPGWLKLSPQSGTLLSSGQFVPIVLSVDITGLSPQTYTTQVSISAVDSSNAPAQGSPQVFTVSLTILPPCTLQVAPLSLPTFSVPEGQPSPSPETFQLSESGSCARPVSWSAVGDSNSSSWLVVSPTSGTDSATVTVSVNSQSLTPGTYTGTITVSASGNGGAIVQNSPQTVSVTLIVTAYTLSGTVIACSDQNCTSSKPLPGASLSLLNNSTNATLTATADSSGNYTFSNVPTGPYTLTVTGSDGQTNYAGTASFNLTGNYTLNVNVYPK